MVKIPDFKKLIIRLICLLSLSGGILVIEGCQSETKRTVDNSSPQSRKIQKLERRISSLEKKVLNNSAQKNIDPKTPRGPIRSITFRTGTKDDRLRIYWADGTKSDLPCTQEQSIWVCG